MKNLYKIVFLLSFVSCKSQIIPLYPLSYSYSTSGAYYQDEQFDLNKFVGTWRFTSGSNSFTIVLQKKTHSYFAPDNCYFDMIVGEYEYIDGTTTISTLSNIDNVNIGDFDHNIKNGYLLFDQRSSTNFQIIENVGVNVEFVNPLRPNFSAYMRITYHMDGNNNPFIKFRLTIPMQIIDGPDDFMINDDEYVMEKVN